MDYHLAPSFQAVTTLTWTSVDPIGRPDPPKFKFCWRLFWEKLFNGWADEELVSSITRGGPSGMPASLAYCSAFALELMKAFDRASAYKAFVFYIWKLASEISIPLITPKPAITWATAVPSVITFRIFILKVWDALCPFKDWVPFG